MYTQGVNPELDFSNLPKLKEIFERCTNMKIGERQPYIGELVFTAFSGSHQDAINKADSMSLSFVLTHRVVRVVQLMLWNTTLAMNYQRKCILNLVH